MMPEDINPFRLTRKSSLFKPTKLKRSIDKIESIGLQECQCISVESEDHLYLTENFVVTHNTFSNQIVIVTECQDCSLADVKAIVTRMGEGSKLILEGDI